MDDYHYNQLIIRLNKIIDRVERIETGLFGPRKIPDTTPPPVYREHCPLRKEEPYP